MADFNCPYCNADQDACHDDGHGYAEEVKHEHQCSECGKVFVFNTYISLHYEAASAECLNDGVHYFEPTITAPRWATKMRCRMCDEERAPTAEERLQYCIPERTAQAAKQGGA